MKLITRLALIAAFTFFMGNISFGQTLSQDVLMSIKDGKTEKLDDLVVEEDLNKCYEIKGSSYNFLAMSVKFESLESLKYFVDKGADLEGVCTGKTPLMYAVKYGQLYAVKYLLESGADLKTTNKGRTALDYAVKYSQPEIEKYLKAYASK